MPAHRNYCRGQWTMDVATIKARLVPDKTNAQPGGDMNPADEGELPDFAAILARGSQTDGTDALREKLIQSADVLTAAHSVTRTTERAERPDPVQRTVRPRPESRRPANERDAPRTTTPARTGRKKNSPEPEDETRNSDASATVANTLDPMVSLTSSTGGFSTALTPEKSGESNTLPGVVARGTGPQDKVNGPADHNNSHQGQTSLRQDFQASTSETAGKKDTKSPAELQPTFRTANMAQSEGLEAAAGDALEGSMKVTVRAEARDGQIRYQGNESGQAARVETWASASSASEQNASNQNGNGGDTSEQNGGAARQRPDSNGLQNGTIPTAGTTGTSAPSFRSALDASSGQNTEAASGPKATSSAQAGSGAAQQGRDASRTASTFKPAQTHKTPDPGPVEQIRVKITKGAMNGDTIRIHLRPESLGKVDIRLEVHEGRVSAHVVADTREALDLLKADARNLERALQDSGLKTDSSSLNFSLRGEGGQQQAGQNDNGRQGPGTPYDPHRQTLDDDLTETPDVETLRRTAAAARGGVDVSI